MADTDTYTNPLVSTIFWGDNPTGEGLTWEQLKARRAIAATLAARSRDYPTTIGKGIYSLAEGIAEGQRERKLDATERRIRAGDVKDLEKNKDLLGAGSNPATVPPVGPPGPAATTAPRAELDPAVDLSRAQMAEALARGADGSRPTAQPLRMAALTQTGTMSDAGQPGATYGGPVPSGPGASLADPPDQAPPAPSDPLSAPAAGPVGTPAPAAAMGGGVGAGQSGDPRGMVTAAQLANQDFNPDRGAGGGAVPPQMVAQVGGFGAGSGAPMPGPTPPGVAGQPAPGLPALPPGTPGQPLPAQGQRPTIPPQFTPPTEAEFNRQFGKAPTAPAQWEPGLRERYNRAVAESLRADRTDQYRAQFKDAAERIFQENKSRYEQENVSHRSAIERRANQFDQLRKDQLEEFKKSTDPVEVQKRDTAAREVRLYAKSGLPPEKLYKTMDAELENTSAAVRRQEDNQMALDAIRNGAITGSFAQPRLDATRFAAWLTNNPQLAARAGDTEILKAKLLGAVSGAIKDFKPISQTEVRLGQSMVGEIGQQPETLRAILNQNIERNNKEIARYDSRAHRFFSGEGEVAETYKSPELTYFNPQHLQRLFGGVAADPSSLPAHIAAFNQRYGPGSAEMVLNRKRLNPDAR